MPKVVIIGGGISGLSTAFYLAKAGIETTLVEQRARLGGVMRTDVVDGCVLEAGPDSFLAAKPAALDLIKEVGLEDQVISSNDHLRVTYIKKNGRLIPMPDGLMMMVPTRVMPLAASSLLSWGTKIRMGLELFRSPKPADHDRSVAEFIFQHYGQETVDYLAEPLLSGVYGGDPREMSASSVLTQFVQLEEKYGSLTRGVLARRKNAAPSGPLFRTLKGGLGEIVSAVEGAIAGRIDVVHQPAESVVRNGEGYRVRVGDGWIEAAHVVLCCPAYQAGTLVPQLDPQLADLLSGVKYNSSVTLALGYDTAKLGPMLEGFGFLIPKVERRKLVACTFVGTKFPHRVPENRAVMRCFLGGSALEEPDDALIAAVREELRELMGITAEPVFSRISRWPRSMAQYTVGHAKRLEDIRGRMAGLPGLHLAGNAYEGIGIPDCIRMGKDAAGRIAGVTGAGR